MPQREITRAGESGNTEAGRQTLVQRHALLAYFLVTFGITWGVGGIFFLFSKQLVARFGPTDLSKPFYNALWRLAVYAPPMAAFLVVGATRGVDGLRSYARRLLHWRAGVKCYLVALFGIPLLYACSRGALFLFTGETQAYPYHPWYTAFPWALLALVSDPGPMEEIGWRGFALPLLQQRFSALGASIILGIIWGIWHLPSFYIGALSQSSLGLPSFLLWTISASVLMTALYNGTRGSIPLVFLFHWQINNPFGVNVYPGGLPTAALLGTAAAIVVTIVLGPRCLGKTKYTTAVPDAGSPALAA